MTDVKILKVYTFEYCVAIKPLVVTLIKACILSEQLSAIIGLQIENKVFVAEIVTGVIYTFESYSVLPPTNPRNKLPLCKWTILYDPTDTFTHSKKKCWKVVRPEFNHLTCRHECENIFAYAVVYYRNNIIVVL